MNRTWLTMSSRGRLAGGVAVLLIATAGCAQAPPSQATGPTGAATTAADRAAASVHASAATAEQPLVLVVRAEWCPTCKHIEPTVAALEREYGGRVSFLVLDVSDDDAAERSAAAAEKAGVGAFFRDNSSSGTVAVFTRQRTLVAKLAGETDVARYREPLATALAAAN